MTDGTIELPRSDIVSLAKAHALEHGTVSTEVPEGCDDWSLKTMSVEEIEVWADTDPTLIDVRGRDTGTVTRTVAPATRYNPPAYEQIVVPVAITVTIALGDGLPTARVTVRAEEWPDEPTGQAYDPVEDGNR